MGPRWPKTPHDGPKTAPRGQKGPPNGPKMAPRGPQDGPQRPQDGPKIAVKNAFRQPVRPHRADHTGRANPQKRGRRWIAPWASSIRRPPSVEGERGVSNLGSSSCQNLLPSKEGSRGARGDPPAPPHTALPAHSVHPLPPWEAKSDRKNTVYSPKFGSRAVLGPLGAVLGPASGLLRPSWD